MSLRFGTNPRDWLDGKWNRWWSRDRGRKRRALTERDEAAVQHWQLNLPGNGGEAVARIKVTLLRWLLRCSRRACAPVMMMVLPVRVGMRTASGRGGPRAIGTDAAQTEDAAAGRLRSQRRHFLKTKWGWLLMRRGLNGEQIDAGAGLVGFHQKFRKNGHAEVLQFKANFLENETRYWETYFAGIWIKFCTDILETII